MDAIMRFNDWLNSIVWGPPMLILLIGTGLVLIVTTGFIIYRKFGFILRNTFLKMFEKTEADASGVTPFQAVSTALASTVGTGNIAGVATAITLGGPGAVFWMWFAAIVGMTTKYAEVTLALAYRQKNEKSQYSGGPMYYITNGLGWKWLAYLFAIFGSLAAFGIGDMTQANSIAGAVQSTFGIDPRITGIILAIVAAAILIGGIQRIGQFAEKVVPFMAAFYILGALIILIMEFRHIPAAFGLIFNNAFNLKAAGSGALGFTMAQALRYGVARGVFTNEAGLGSAPIAHSAATTDHPARQGMWGSFEVFVDTILICTMSALVILTSGVYSNPELKGAALTSAAFGTGFPGGQYIVTIALLLFAFTTIVGWCYYGEKCIEYLFGSAIITPYRIIYVILIYIGAVGGLEFVWGISDTLNGLMAIHNLIAVLILSPVVVRLTKDFFADPERKRLSPMEYEPLLRRPKVFKSTMDPVDKI